VLGDGCGDASAFESWLCGDEADPAELAVTVEKRSIRFPRPTLFLDDYESVGCTVAKALDAVGKRRRPVGPAHHGIHGIERRRLGHGVDTSRRHGGRA
jgi:hypothetical protein